LAEWFGKNVNSKNFTITNAGNVVLHGSDGSRGSRRSAPDGCVDDIVPLIRVWWSGWLSAACSG
jgi:hypothetical protein